MAGVNDVVAALKARSGLTEAEARRRLDDVLEAVQTVLIEAGEVRLPIGIFRVADRKGGAGRNPRTGEAVEIPSRRVVKFRPSAGLRERVARP